jgi:hypothetical protein
MVHSVQPTEHVAADGRIWGRVAGGVYSRDSSIPPPPRGSEPGAFPRVWRMPTDRTPMTVVERPETEAPRRAARPRASVRPFTLTPPGEWRPCRYRRRAAHGRTVTLPGFPGRMVEVVPDDGISIRVAVGRVSGHAAVYAGRHGVAFRAPLDGWWFVAPDGSVVLAPDGAVQVAQKRKVYRNSDFPPFCRRPPKNASPARVFSAPPNETRLNETTCEVCQRPVLRSARGPASSYCSRRCRQRVARSRRAAADRAALFAGSRGATALR